LKKKLIAFAASLAMAASCAFSSFTVSAADTEEIKTVSSQSFSQSIIEENDTLELYADEADEDPGYIKYYNSCVRAASAANTSNGLTYNKYGDCAKTWGIDVSKYQGTINWSSVKASGIDYVIIRAGFRGYGGGDIVGDSQFFNYIKGAKAVGLKVGVYFYSQAINEAEALAEAQYCLDCVKGYTLEYPIYIDMEYASASGRVQKANLSKAAMTSIVTNFCQRVNSGGYRAGLYASKSWLDSYFNMSQIEDKYSVWVAHWASATSYSRAYEMWQYTETGSVNGISGTVDGDVHFDNDMARNPQSVAGTSTTVTTTAPKVTTAPDTQIQPPATVPEPVERPMVENPELGDANADGYIDPIDATAILIEAATLLNGDESTFNEKQQVAADVDGDGIVSPSDATIVLIYSAEVLIGLEESFEEWVKIAYGPEDGYDLDPFEDMETPTEEASEAETEEESETASESVTVTA
jgi:GH25 family lysozyme M1 (1,4-beta-N-acetylmuramidase)